MTDPAKFAIKGGANPHTRTADNRLKSVNRKRAMAQWQSYVDALLEAGVDVYVMEAEADLTGMVFTANAGFLTNRLDPVPAARKTFYPSRFTAEHRIPEADRYRQFMEKFGFNTAAIPKDWRFEGEADAFPVGRDESLRWLFTYGFRSDPEVGNWLENQVVEDSMLKLELTRPSYYHGDCLICDLGGPLLAWPDGLTQKAQKTLYGELESRIVELGEPEAKAFMGNSFYVETARDRLLYTPVEIADETRRRIEELGITVVPVDISEFFTKGGGGPKCMVFNLGPIDADGPEASSKVRAFRHERHVKTLRRQGYFD